MIYICEYDGTIENRILQERGKTLLPQLEEIPAEGMKWEKRRERILARMLLDFALQKEAGISLDELSFSLNKSGKPCSLSHPEIKFNLSHCDSACACVIGMEENGIDIEKKFEYRENLARKVCHEEEWDILQKLAEEERKEQLHILWSAKESFVKWDGRGLAYGMNRVNLSSFLPIYMMAGECRPVKLGELWFYLKKTDNYTLSACSKAKEESCVLIQERFLGAM